MFSKKKPAAAMAAPKGAKLPRGLDPKTVKRAFPDRAVNVNVATMVHLHLGAKILDHLTEREIINFGVDSNKTEEAKAVSKQVKRFLNRLTLAHERAETLSFGEFANEVQGHADAMAMKLFAILESGDRKLGSADAELAEPLSQGMKSLIALDLRGLSELFSIGGNRQRAIEAHIDKRGQENDPVVQFISDTIATIQNGNGTRSYRYIRMAAASIADLSRDEMGMGEVEARVGHAIEQHGTLSNDLMSFKDVPEFEEEVENLDCLFDMENLSVEKYGGAMALSAYAALEVIATTLRHDDELDRAIDNVAALLSDEEWSALTAGGASEQDALSSFSAFLSAGCKRLASGFSGRPDDRTPTTRIKAFQSIVGRAAELLKAVSDVTRYTTIADETLSEGKAQRMRLFFDVMAGRLASAAEHGAVMLSDRDIPHAVNGVVLLESMTLAVDAGVEQELKDTPPGVKPPSGVTLPESGAVAKKLLDFFSHTALHKANTAA